MPTKTFEKMLRNINPNIYIKHKTSRFYNLSQIMLKDGEINKLETPNGTEITYHNDKFISACASDFIPDIPILVIGHDRLKQRTLSQLMQIIKDHKII